MVSILLTELSPRYRQSHDDDRQDVMSPVGAGAWNISMDTGGPWGLGGAAVDCYADAEAEPGCTLPCGRYGALRGAEICPLTVRASGCLQTVIFFSAVLFFNPFCQKWREREKTDVL